MDDAHADDVIIQLADMGHEPVRLNTDDIPLNARMSFNLKDSGIDWQGSIDILTNERVIDPTSIKSIWWRRPDVFALPTDLSLQEREFAQDEIDHALRGLWASLDCYWISYPEHIRQAGWKLEQLQRAARLGFEVPNTLVTSNPEKARAFYEECNGQLIFKVLTDPFLGAPKIISKYPDEETEPFQSQTTFITEHELPLLDSVSLVPCLFQEYIPKQLELRIAVIGDELFAAEIHSQEREETRIDWRNYEVDIPYRKANLPSEVASRCLEFVKSYNLNFSAMDLILTPDGRYVFLENNPNGQFIFIEQMVPELRMTEALAACLARSANS